MSEPLPNGVTRMTRDELPPHRAVIELDVFVWERHRAAAIVEQLVKFIEHAATNDQGGVTRHHRIRGVTVTTDRRLG